MAEPHDPWKRVESILAEAIEQVVPGAASAVLFERPRNPEHGDLSTSVALQLAKAHKRKPRELAERIAAAAGAALRASGVCESLAVDGPGFLNVRLTRAAKLEPIRRALAEGAAYGRARQTEAPKTQVEFVSANPTGPLHVGHGRQAALGDAIAALLEAQGFEVTREFYYNDAGAQIDNLVRSVQARGRGLKPGDPGWPTEAYNGDYIRDIAHDFLARKTVRAADGAPVRASGDLADAEAVRRFAVAYLRHEQDTDLKRFGVKFDIFCLESSLYADGKVEEAVKALVASGKTYEREGALWLRTTDYGDDKDRVVRRSDGTYTYFVPDVAYHLTKWRRGFRRAINVQGTDHHGTTARVRAGLQALGAGIPQGYPEYVLHSLVRVMRGGEEVRISKRAGSYVTLRDLLDWAGRDAVRFFLVSRRADADFVFDVDLARAQTEENPVYYLQYAHARVCSVFAQWRGDPASLGTVSLEPLKSERELALAQKIGEWPEVVRAAARELAPHSIAFYLRELAAQFHSYYNAERILVEDGELKSARLALAAAVRHTLANGLTLLGVGAPEKM